MKKRNMAFLLSSLASLFLTTLALADWTGIRADEYSMASPPRRNSTIDREDYAALLRYQNSDRAEACELAASQFRPTYENFYFGSSILSRKEYEKAEPLVTRAIKYADKISTHFKQEFIRPRPYDTDPRIKPCIRTPGGNRSYPSSHAAMATFSACVLGAIFPNQADDFRSYGKYLGDIRYIVGVHHPTDVQAGQKLGKDMCKRILSEPTFKREVEDLKN